MATVTNKTRIMEWLIKYKANVDATFTRNALEYTPLIGAAVEGLVEPMEILIKNGASVNYAGKDGMTALLMAILHGHNNVTKLLLESGANASGSPKFSTPLLYAINANNTEAVDLLIKFGADVNLMETDNNKFFPLALAVATGKEEMFRKLIDAGARVDRIGNMGYNLLHIAAENDFVEVVPQLISLVNSRADEDITPLHIAVTFGHLRMVKMLIKNGADVKARYYYIGDNKKRSVRSAMSIAVTKDQLDMVKILIENGADVNEKFDKKVTPLHFAAQLGYIDMAKYLIAKGADLNALTTERGTPYDLARCFSPNPKMASYLKRQGGYSVLTDYRISCVSRDKKDKIQSPILNPFLDNKEDYKDFFGGYKSPTDTQWGNTVKTIEPTTHGASGGKIFIGIVLFILCVFGTILKIVRCVNICEDLGVTDGDARTAHA